jgi:hypothetical protein
MHMCAQVETREMDFEPDFLRHIFPRINWPALREAAAAMGEPALLACGVAVARFLRLLWVAE